MFGCETSLKCVVFQLTNNISFVDFTIRIVVTDGIHRKMAQNSKYTNKMMYECERTGVLK